MILAELFVAINHQVMFSVSMETMDMRGRRSQRTVGDSIRENTIGFGVGLLMIVVGVGLQFWNEVNINC